MYEEFYGLSVDPFRLSPDHRFSFSHRSYAKAKAYIQYALHRAEGFVMVTGMPGTGKTTLVNEVVEGLPRDGVAVATLVSTQLEADDLLRMVAYSFGLGADAPQKALVLQRLMDFLFRAHREGRRALLIIDEAQDLSDSALEELRLLTNLQQAGQPLLQIVLLGQESLRDLVRKPNMEQVHQRLVAACDLQPLGRLDTLAYIRHRLGRAGWRGDPKIERETWPIIYEFSRGVPRRINLVCSRLFLHGCVEERHTLTVKEAALVVAELQQEELAPEASGAGLDLEPLPADFAADGWADEKVPEPPELAHEVARELAGEGPPKMLNSLPGDDVREEIAGLAGDGEGGIGEVDAAPGLSRQAEPVTGSDAQGPYLAAEQVEHREQTSLPQGLSGTVHPGAEDGAAHGRAPSRKDGLQEDPGTRRGVSQADQADGPDRGSENTPAREPGARPRLRAGLGVQAASNADTRVFPDDNETITGVSGGFADEQRGAARGVRPGATVFLLAVVLVVAVAAGFYFRPAALEQELGWLERRLATIQDTVRALAVQLNGVGSGQGDPNRYGQPAIEVGESGHTATQSDQRAEVAGKAPVHPAPQAEESGPVVEARGLSAGSPSTEMSASAETEAGVGEGRVGNRATIDALPAIAE